MKTLTNLGLKKIVTKYINSLSHVEYKLNGVDNTKDFLKIEIVNNTVLAYIFFDESYKGAISDIRVIDVDGDVVAKNENTYERTVEKALYLVFKHEFKEV